MKKKLLILSVVCLSIFVARVAYAWAMTNGTSYVKSNEIIQLYYVGEAYSTRPRNNWVYIEYYRDSNFLGGAYAYAGHTYQSVTIMDSLNPVASKTMFYYRI